MSATLSTSELRRRNRNLIYRYLYSATTPVTKQSVSDGLSMSLPTVTQNFRDLMDSGLIRWGQTLHSTGGRKPKTIEIVADAKVAIGIEITLETLYLVVVDLKGDAVAEHCMSRHFSDSESYAQFLGKEIETVVQAHHLEKNRILGVGITLPGVLDEASGMIEIAPTLQIRKMKAAALSRYIAYPVRFENDATSGGRAETWNFRDSQLRAYLSVSEGVGGCIMIGAEPYLGNNKRAAEFGHMRIVPNGRPCLCGKRGCLEAYCSTLRLSADLGCSLDSFFILLKDGSGRCVNAWESYLDSLASGINNIRMLLDCDIILGGTLSQFLSPYLGRLNSKLRSLDCFDSPRGYLTLSRLGAYSNSTGAAMAYIQKFINTI